MRKVSKNRTDEDVISSTNGSGSVDKEGKRNAEHSTEESKKKAVTSSDDDNDTDDVSDEEESIPLKKLNSTKNKSKREMAKKTKVGQQEEYEVEKIINSKRIKRRLYYLIRWKGYTSEHDSWEPDYTLSCPELVNKYNEEKENTKDKDSPKGKKSNKRKSNAKTKSLSKKVKTQESDSEESDENAEYEVERILEVHHKKSGKRDFLIHWKGWSSKFDSWEPESNLNCPELIKKFMEKVDAARSSESRSLRVAPETTNRFTLQDPSSGRRLSKRKSQRQRVRYDNAE